MSFKKVMKEYEFEDRGSVFRREEEEVFFEVIRVGNRYVFRREIFGRFGDVDFIIDICSSVEELKFVLGSVFYSEED